MIFQKTPVSVKSLGRVAVLMGGWSAEREVSLNSGRAVYNALIQAGVDAHAIDANQEAVLALDGFDVVFNIMHGRGGEDGVLQALMDLKNIPCTGSGVMGSAIAMDKLRTKWIWAGMGLSTPKYRVMRAATDATEVLKTLRLPLMVKPAQEGSSIGMSKVNNPEELPLAFERASEYGEVFVEEWIEGREYTAGILNGQPLPLIKLETNQDFYDYEAKYERNDTQYTCPCGLGTEKERELQALALDAFNSVGASNWGRVDLMLDHSGKPWLIEVNTVPGMTSHSLVPMAAKQAGLDFEELVVEVLAGVVNGSEEHD